MGLPQNRSDEEGQGIYKRFLLAKKLRPAELSITPSSHRGLGVDAYIQATSPLRRYPDLVMLRQIIHFLRSGEPFYSIENLSPIVHRAEEELRELARIEENRKRYWFLKYLSQTRLKGTDTPLFQSVVLDQMPNRSALIELLEFPFRARVILPKTCSPGEIINLRLETIDLWRKSAKFALEQ
jgi:exoribonuclease-2